MSRTVAGSPPLVGVQPWRVARTRRGRAKAVEMGDILCLTKDVCAVTKPNPAASQVVEAVVDSGAEESVAPPGLFAGVMEPSAMSKAGGKYRAANGTRIRNLGQQMVRFRAEGQNCGMPFQIAEVERPLISVAQLAAAGNTVELDAEGGKIINRASGRVLTLVRKGGVYILPMQTDCRRLGRGRG